MNRAGASKFVPAHQTSREGVEANVDGVYDRWMAEQWAAHLSHIAVEGTGQVVFSPEMRPREVPTMGYVTSDLCPGVGDDIEHVPGKSVSPRVSARGND